MAPHLDGVGRVVAAVEVLDGDVGAVLGALAIRLALALKLVLCERPLVTPRKPPLLPLPPSEQVQGVLRGTGGLAPQQEPRVGDTQLPPSVGPTGVPGRR